MTLPYRYIGCDISKLWLDLYDPQEGRVRRIANTRKATEDLARSLAGSPAFVVFEATGPYERALRQNAR
jgi:transposase